MQITSPGVLSLSVSPWHFSGPVFQKLQQQTGASYAKHEITPSDPEWKLVDHCFQIQAPPNRMISRVWVIYNSALTRSFEGMIAIQEKEAVNPVFAPKWKQEKDLPDLREKMMKRWQGVVDPYSPFSIRWPNTRKDTYIHTKIIPLWHGTKASICDSICQSGFAVFGKHAHVQGVTPGQTIDPSTDIGFFGSGYYFTTSARYATDIYSDGNLLLGWVSMRAPYPVVADQAFPARPSDMQKLATGMGAYQNYNAHYIPTVPIKPNDPLCANYYPCTETQTPVLDEIVVFDKAQTLPYCWVELTPVIFPLIPLVPSPKPTPIVTTPAPPKPVILPIKPLGKAVWEQYIGFVGNEPEIPDNLVKILSADCPIWPGKKVKDTQILVLVPKTVNGVPLNFKTLGELVQKPLRGHPTKYKKSPNLGEYPDPNVSASHWALISRDIMPGSSNMSDQALQNLLAGIAKKSEIKYQTPFALDMAVCIFMEFIHSGRPIYSRQLMASSLTKCQEHWNASYPLFVGDFSEKEGLFVGYKSIFDSLTISTSQDFGIGLQCIEF